VVFSNSKVDASTSVSSPTIPAARDGEPKRIWVNLGKINPKSDKVREELPSSLKFCSDEFPSLREASHLHLRGRKYRPPFDSEDWNFKYTLKRKDFSFEEVANASVKIKAIPIQLNWRHHQ
jgi:TFIIF-interacting CTD phosphatase-like protein